MNASYSALFPQPAPYAEPSIRPFMLLLLKTEPRSLKQIQNQKSKNLKTK